MMMTIKKNKLTGLLSILIIGMLIFTACANTPEPSPIDTDLITEEEITIDLIEEKEVQEAEDYGAKGAMLKAEYTLEEMMKYAIEDAEIKLEDIDHINTHGTSTPVGDISEPKAIVSLFGEHAYKININSTKSMTGHMLGAAGATEAIATALTVKNDIIPPTINHFTDDPNIDNKLNFTYHKAVKRVVNYALTNTFGFGGHNASIVIKKFVR
jgi:3-oxoacyl-(acyl-carrier-protein) synthase